MYSMLIFNKRKSSGHGWNRYDYRGLHSETVSHGQPTSLTMSKNRKKDTETQKVSKTILEFYRNVIISVSSVKKKTPPVRINYSHFVFSPTYKLVNSLANERLLWLTGQIGLKVKLELEFNLFLLFNCQQNKVNGLYKKCFLIVSDSREMAQLIWINFENLTRKNVRHVLV